MTLPDLPDTRFLFSIRSEGYAGVHNDPTYEDLLVALYNQLYVLINRV